MSAWPVVRCCNRRRFSSESALVLRVKKICSKSMATKARPDMTGGVRDVLLSSNIMWPVFFSCFCFSHHRAAGRPLLVRSAVGPPFVMMTFDSFQNDFSRNFDILQTCLLMLASNNQRKAVRQSE